MGGRKRMHGDGGKEGGKESWCSLKWNQRDYFQTNTSLGHLGSCTKFHMNISFEAGKSDIPILK